MNEPLHPLTLGEILDRTAQMYRSRFLVYFGIGVIPAGTLVILAGASFGLITWAGASIRDSNGGGAQTAIAFLILGLLGLIGLPAYLASTTLGWAALNDAASRAFLGQPITIRSAYRNVMRRGWHYLGLYMLIALFVFIGPFIVFFIGLMIVGGIAAAVQQTGAINFLIGLAMVILIPGLFAYAVWMLLRVALAFPACVVEQSGVWSAVKRAAVLSKGTRGRMILLFLLGWALNTLLMIAAMVPLGIIIALVPGVSSPQHSERLGQIIILVWYGLSFALQAFTHPVYGIGLTLFYFDQRIRKEGFDIEWMMRDAGMVLPSPPQAVLPEAIPWLAQMPAITAQIPTAPAFESAEPSPPPQVPPPAGDPA